MEELSKKHKYMDLYKYMEQIEIYTIILYISSYKLDM